MKISECTIQQLIEAMAFAVNIGTEAPPTDPAYIQYKSKLAAVRIEALGGEDSLESLIREIQVWQKEVFPKATVSSTAEHLRREAIELCANPSDNSEAVDIFFLLVGWMQCRGISVREFSDDVKAKWEVNKRRKWGKPDEHGVCEHVKSFEELDIEAAKRNGSYMGIIPAPKKEG